MELREALNQISHIREHLARGEVFRGYRSSTVACSGLLAIVGAGVQPLVVPRPLEQLVSYLLLWVGIALVCVSVEGMKLWMRYRAHEGSWGRQLTVQAIETFLPCLTAGAILTCVIVQQASEIAWMLPGLWALLFSLGVFASSRLLPRPVIWVGLYYMLCAVVYLLGGGPAAGLSPWSMGVTFGGGQLLTAAILYLTLERGPRGEEEA
jgi:hypothetical protein